MICRLCFHLFEPKDKIRVVKGGTVHDKCLKEKIDAKKKRLQK